MCVCVCVCVCYADSVVRTSRVSMSLFLCAHRGMLVTYRPAATIQFPATRESERGSDLTFSAAVASAVTLCPARFRSFAAISRVVYVCGEGGRGDRRRINFADCVGEISQSV